MLLEVIFVCGDGVVLLEYGSEADVVDDDEALAAAVVVEVLDPTEGEEVRLIRRQRHSHLIRQT